MYTTTLSTVSSCRAALIQVQVLPVLLPGPGKVHGVGTDSGCSCLERFRYRFRNRSEIPKLVYFSAGRLGVHFVVFHSIFGYTFTIGDRIFFLYLRRTYYYRTYLGLRHIVFAVFGSYRNQGFSKKFSIAILLRFRAVVEKNSVFIS